MKRRVVITGMEIASSIGCGLEKFWDAAAQGRCGIRRIERYDPTPYSTQIAGEIAELPFDDCPQFGDDRRYPKAAQYALFCAHHAIRRSGLDAEALKPAGTFLGTSLGGTPELEAPYRAFFSEGWKKIPVLSVLRAMPNAVANHLAIAFGLHGPNSTISNACVSSAEAIGHAYHHILTGQLNVAVCGGSESLIWESIMATWCRLRIMSTNNEFPHLACRPFDAQRQGMIMADGAAILVLESYEHAKARGAAILAEIVGYGATCDAHHITAPSSEGQVRAVQLALNQAQLSPNDVQYINAHGTGTKLNDLIETQTIKTVFGNAAYDIPITAQKAMTGHSIGAAGAIEIATTVLSMQHDLLLPTINLHHPDPECDLDYIPNVARQKKIDIAISNHFAFGGANAVLILQNGTSI